MPRCVTQTHILTIIGILLVRTWAVWNRSTHLAVALGVVMLGATVGNVTLLVLWKSALIRTWEQSLPADLAVASLTSLLAVSTNFTGFLAGRCDASEMHVHPCHV